VRDGLVETFVTSPGGSSRYPAKSSPVRLRRQNTDDPRVEHDLDVLADAYASGARHSPVPAGDAPPRKGWRRDNASDPRVLADLELLAAHDAGTLPPTAAPGDGDPMADPFVRRFLAGAQHVRGHAKYYGALAAWLLLMFAVVPVVTHDGHAVVADGDGLTTAAAAVEATTTSTTAVGAVTPAPAPSIPEVSSPMPTFTAAAVPPPATSSSATAPVTATTASTAVAAPAYLTIARSGYASASGGTPLEQEPADGALPVQAAGGQATKRSFVGLRGSGTVLHLAVVDGATGDGSVAACPLSTSDWSTDRGQSMPGPAFSSTCAVGRKLGDGTWVFDHGQCGDPAAGAGFALTPMAGTFSLAFSPAALPPG
jgi:hypothetical protein